MYLPYIFFFFLFSFLSTTAPTLLALQTPLFLPIAKDHSTLQYTLTLYLKTPPKPAKLLLDLGGTFSWVNCQTHYSSTTYNHIPCNSSLCASFHSLACSNCYDAPGPSCANDTCALFPENPVTRKAAISNALIDSLAFAPGRLGLVPEFIFSCSTTSLLKGLASGVSGSAGFGRSGFSLPAQVSTAHSLPFLFALCLSGSPTAAPGVSFFGFSGPYNFYPEIDLSKSLIYTPLLLNPVGSTIITYYGQPSDEYYIGLTSIKVNGKAIELNGTILTIDENGFGGTKISTVTPYTVLEAAIYKAFVEAFVNESAALNLTVTNAVKPFDVCYLAADVYLTRMGPAVPTVDLVLHSEDVFWRIFGSNSMVKIEAGNGEDVWCLGFLDGGVNARTAVVIGGHQMEDNFLQFDLGLKRLGFSSSILAQGTNCANFNITKQT